jgi:hypothetical protein
MSIIIIVYYYTIFILLESLIFAPLQVGVVFLRADAVISEMKPNGKSFIAPTSVAKENKRKKVIDTILVLVLIAILAFDLTQAGMAYSKMNLEACVFEQRNREDMTRYEN